MFYFHSAVPRVGDDATDTGDRNMIIAIIATIGFFIIGIVFGILCHKKYHSRSCMNKKRVGVGGGICNFLYFISRIITCSKQFSYERDYFSRAFTRKVTLSRMNSIYTVI